MSWPPDAVANAACWRTSSDDWQLGHFTESALSRESINSSNVWEHELHR